MFIWGCSKSHLWFKNTEHCWDSLYKLEWKENEEDEIEKLRKRKRKDMEYAWVKTDSRRF